jgi:chromosome partitioning protein
MRSIAFINQKGGVGKTTTTVNVAAGLARGGARVLLLDLDPQAHASLHLGIEVGAGQTSIYDVLIRSASLYETIRRADERLDVIPAHVDLVAAELELADHPRRQTVLREALGAPVEHYDYLLVDCAPSLGLLSVNALAAVGEVIIPLQPHFLALQGLGKLLETVSLVRAGLRPGLRVCGVALCMFERGTRLAQEVRSDVEQFLAQAPPDAPWHGARVFDTCIRRNIKLAECPSFGRTIFTYAPDSHGADDYAALAAEIAATGAPPGPSAAGRAADAGDTAGAGHVHTADAAALLPRSESSGGASPEVPAVAGRAGHPVQP